MQLDSSALKRLELEMVDHDLLFFYDLIQKTSSAKEIGILVFGLIPYYSLFILESYKYICSVEPNYEVIAKRKHEDIITSSRHQVKLFDGTRQDVQNVMKSIDTVVKLYLDWFVNSHKGLLSELKKLIQTDLGLYIYNNHIIATTHIAFFNLGYADHISLFTQGVASGTPLSSSFGHDVGQYLSLLYRFLHPQDDFIPPTFCKYNIQGTLLRSKDVKSKNYYTTIFNGTSSEQLNACLMFFMTSANFASYILPELVESRNFTFFKIKFLTLYHLVISLTKFQNYFYNQNILTTRSKEYFKKIFSGKDLKRIKNRADFRNILVHYNFENYLSKQRNVLVNFQPDREFYGLVEHFFNGNTAIDVDDLIDSELHRIATILEEWSGWKI
jgi:hypothetical protein